MKCLLKHATVLGWGEVLRPRSGQCVKVSIWKEQNSGSLCIYRLGWVRGVLRAGGREVLGGEDAEGQSAPLWAHLQLLLSLG